MLKKVMSFALAGAMLVAAAPNSREERYKKDVVALSADDMEGRGVGTQGLIKSAGYLEKRLRDIGLKPAFGSSYRQSFPIKTGVELEEGNIIEGLSDSEWIPLGFSSSGPISGEIAFVGYGIDAPAIGYRELEGIDLKGEIALMLRYEPQEKDDASPFDGRRPSRWSAVRYRVMQARERGASAVIFVTGPLQDEDKDKLPALHNDGPESSAGIPVIQVKTSTAQRWLSKAGVDLKTFQQQVDRDLKPRSLAATGTKLSGRVALKANFANAENVVGMIPGKGSLANEIVVIGAHYDHLGKGGRGSMRPNVYAIHNGADDNASGTAAILLAAEALRNGLKNSKNHRTIVAALFSGEEVGLAGSSYFVANAPFDMGRVVAMLNLDMVGRLRNDELVALGSDTAPEWAPALERLSKPLNLKVTARGDGYGPSDQTSFYAARVPVLHFFTGTHEQYHTPDDDAPTINFEGGARVAQLTAAVAKDVATGAVNPKYTRLTSAPLMEGDSRGYGAYLGTVPDYRAMQDTEGGVLLSDVRPGGPADLAGIKGGDRLIEMAGTKIANLYDMTYALQDHKPGETIDVIVLRDGKNVRLRATLGDRRTMGSPAAAPNQPKAAAAPATPASPHAAPAAPPQPASPHAAPAAPAAPPAPTTPKAPADPHAAMQAPAAAAGPEWKNNEFYKNRPGADLKLGAGKPFEKVYEGEKHLKDIRQLTFGGENAEAYFSPDGTRLIFQQTKTGACDQQYVLDLKTGELTLVSSGEGRTTCGYYDWPEGDRIVYASTVAAGKACPPTPDRSQGYVWPIYDSYDIYDANPDGSNPRKLTSTPGYDAEATWCHRGGKMVFTSMRDGDLDLYAMDEAGNVTRLTTETGYDGGAFYSPDCSEIVWRANRPAGAELDEYKSLLGKGLIRPTKMELMIMKADGTGARQLTDTGKANFCPYFHPDGKRIIYSSNAGSARPFEFDLLMIDKNGGEPERITSAPGFDGFPVFSPDGEWLVFASNRGNPQGFETNLFIAKWVE